MSTHTQTDSCLPILQLNATSFCVLNHAIRKASRIGLCVAGEIPGMQHSSVGYQKLMLTWTVTMEQNYPEAAQWIKATTCHATICQRSQVMSYLRTERNKLAFEVSSLHHLLQFTLARLLARDCSCVFLCVKMQYSIFVHVSSVTSKTQACAGYDFRTCVSKYWIMVVLVRMCLSLHVCLYLDEYVRV